MSNSQEPKYARGDVVVLVRYPKLSLTVAFVRETPWGVWYELHWKGEECYEHEQNMEHAHIAASPLWQALR